VDFDLVVRDGAGPGDHVIQCSDKAALVALMPAVIITIMGAQGGRPGGRANRAKPPRKPPHLRRRYAIRLYRKFVL
jgi:hypothetical protein